MPSFNDLSLQSTTLAVLNTMGISEPTPIQAAAIPALLSGKDFLGQSATGSGKTLAYGIPLVERLSKQRVVQALILVPTRELAVQVNTVLGRLALGRRLTTALLVGGKPYTNQISSLRYGAQIVVGTPGRVKDHLDRGTLTLNNLRICVLDEADQMLDIGFAPVIEEILTTTPENRQMALLSATMPEWVAKIQQKFLKNPVTVDITPAMGGESTIEQVAYQVPHDQKMAALCTLLQSADGQSSLIFGKTKFGVEKLGKQLTRLGFTVGTLHGNKSQSAREKVLMAFRRGQVQTLLATNVAARGLDIKGISQVINYELPESNELFTHRVGRTGRMGQQGKAITLLVPSDLPKWRRMTRTMNENVPLQRLTINQDAMIESPLPEPVIHPAYTPQDEYRPARSYRPSFQGQNDQRSRSPRDRRPSYQNQERPRRAHVLRESHEDAYEFGGDGSRLAQDRQPLSLDQERNKRGQSNQDKSFSSEKSRVVRKSPDKVNSSGRSTGSKHSTASFEETESRDRSYGRKPGTKPTTPRVRANARPQSPATR